MARVDCPCSQGVPGADDECEARDKESGGKPVCGFEYECDRCHTQFNCSKGGYHRQYSVGADFVSACESFAQPFAGQSRKHLLGNEFEGDYCQECMSALIKWAPVLADILYLQAHVNYLQRSISDVKKDRNYRAT